VTDGDPNLAAQLEAIGGGDLHGSLQEVKVPMYVVDREGTIVWLNDAGKELIPDGVGAKFTEVVAPELVVEARERFELRIHGQEPFVDHTLVVEDPGGQRRDIEISSAPLREAHKIVGVFGVVRSSKVKNVAREKVDMPRLTPRQLEVLHLLGAGYTTRQMADHMGVSIETVRNHVRMLLAQLGARSRLQAVLVGHERGLLNGADEPSRV
jgi:PAS domain S-box-containing protein